MRARSATSSTCVALESSSRFFLGKPAEPPASPRCCGNESPGRRADTEQAAVEEAERQGINVVGVDIGGATTDVFSVFDRVFNRTVSANLGEVDVKVGEDVKGGTRIASLGRGYLLPLGWAVLTGRSERAASKEEPTP